MLLNEETKNSFKEKIIVLLFDLILYVPSTIFQLNRDGSSWVEPELSQDKCVLLKGHNAVTPVRLELESSTLPLRHCAPAAAYRDAT